LVISIDESNFRSDTTHGKKWQFNSYVHVKDTMDDAMKTTNALLTHTAFP
jgi:hypothetical protein